MGNCLKTQLKESVNNSNLPFFNLIDIEISPTTTDDIAVNNSTSSNFAFDGDAAMEILEGSNVTATFSNGGKSVEHTTGQAIYLTNITANQKVTLRCTNKYNLLRLRPALQYCGTTENLKYCSKLERLETNKINGDVADLPNIRFVSIEINTPDFYGDYNELVSRLPLTITNMANTFSKSKVKGDLSLTPADVFYVNGGDATLGAYNTWTPGVRANSDCKCLAIGGNNCTGFMSAADVDNFFIDNAECTLDPNGTTINIKYIKGISSYSPTAAAQTAIATLYQKGFTSIKVLDVEMSA